MADANYRVYEMEDLTTDIIAQKPWAQDMLKKAHITVEKAVLNWCNIVMNIGESEVDLDSWVSIFLHSLTQHLGDIVFDVDLIKQKLLDKIEDLVQKSIHMSSDLRLKPPTDNFENMTLSQVKRHLNETVNKYEEIVGKRIEELNRLRNSQKELCEVLGCAPKPFPGSPLPTDEEMEQFKKHVEKLDNEKFRREESFLQIKSDIVDIINELKLQPSLEFEKQLVNTEAILITDGNMKQLKIFYENVVKQQKDVKEEINDLRQRIDAMWDILDVPIIERDNFRKNYTANSLETLEILRQELNRCKELKKANIKIFIDKLRDDLLLWWTKCHQNEDVRKSFPFYDSDCYTEDILELFEREIANWKRYYDENKEIFDLLERHQTIWSSFMEIELNSNGANRLKNRGGQLLREEKERKRLTKQLPKIEAALQQLSDGFFNSKGRHFLTFDLTIEQYITKAHCELEMERKNRVSAKKQERDQQMVLTPAKCGTSLFPPVNSHILATPQSHKRKNLTPFTDQSKKQRTILLNTKKITAPKLTLCTNYKLNLSRRRRSSIDKKKVADARRRLSKKFPNENIDPTDCVSKDYAAFEKEISTREACRSTTVFDKHNLAAPLPMTPRP